MYPAVKRCLDGAAAFVLGALLFLPLCLIALLIRLDSPGPALFRQRRVGKGGRVFTVYKFRTMLTSAPSDRATCDFADADAYITRVGRLLRRASLDELPQLLNVLEGTMSFVGYRPVCVTETELNALRQTCGVFALRPGITGLAQVCGRDDLSREEKVRLDAFYVRRCSPKLDLWCLWKTVQAVITGEGVR